jgi:hypothetical protein
LTRQRASCRHEGCHEQASVSLDPHHHLTRLLDVVADQVMEAGDAFHTLRKTATPEAFAVLALHADVVVGLSPVHPDKDHLDPSSFDQHQHEPEDPAASSQDQCSRHDIPPAVTGTSPTIRGTI